MYYYKYVCVLILISSCSLTAFCHTLVPKIDSTFNVFSEINNFIGSATNLINLFNSFKDIFSVEISDNNTKLENISTTPGLLHEDSYLNITELAKKYGYGIQEHKVTTEDGYILTFHNIPFRNKTNNKEVVFLMHGILDSSDSWVLQGPGNALAYILVDQGFDVWMGNSRGNKYCLEHTSLSVKQSDFWDFTWEEIGLYDLPAMIDYTLNATNKESLYYIGHSQGTTSFYVMNSMKPEYNDKVKLMFSLAPVAWMRHVKSPIVKMFSPAYKVLGYLLSNFNTYSSTTELFNKIGMAACSFLPLRCDNILYMIVGNDYKFLNESMLPVIFGHMPCGSSTFQFVHYGQLVESGRFCRYDYGNGNIEVYGQSVPPDYDLSNIKVPVVLYYSDNDWLSDPSDVDLLKCHLPNVYDYVHTKYFNHLDFMYASIAKDIVYSKIVKQIIDFERLNNNYTKL